MSSTIHTKLDMSILLLLVIGLIVAAIAFRHVWMAAASHVFHPHIAGWLIGGTIVAVLMLRVFFMPVATVHNGNSEVIVDTISATTTSNYIIPPFWIILGVLAIIFIAFAAFGQGQLHSIAKPLFIVVLLGLGGVFFVGMFAYHESRTAVSSQENERMLIAQAEMRAAQSRIPVEHVAELSTAPPDTTPRVSTPAVTPKTPDAEKQSDDKTTTTTDDAKSTSDSLPAWIKNTEAFKDGDYYAVVQSGKDPDPAMRDVRLEARMLAVANDVIDNKMFRGQHMADVANIEPAYLRQYCIVQQYPSRYPVPAGEEIYVKMKFDGQFRKEIERRYHEIVSSDRLTQLGGTALAALAVLSGAYVYLRKTTPKQGSGLGVQGSAQANV